MYFPLGNILRINHTQIQISCMLNDKPITIKYLKIIYAVFIIVYISSC